MAATDHPTVPNDACTHTRATHFHGTHVCYVRDVCRCEPCKVANRAYEAERRRLRAIERFHPDKAVFVDAAPVVAHVNELRAARLGFKVIAKRAGVGNATVGALLWGRHDRRGGVPQTRIRRTVADKILAVPRPTTLADLKPGRAIRSPRSHFHVTSLMTLGWSIARQSRVMGVDVQVLRRIQHDPDPLLQVAHIAAIAHHFRQMRLRAPRAVNRRDAAAIARAINYAQRRRYPDPFELDREVAA